jgi:hypothetical protein
MHPTYCEVLFFLAERSSLDFVSEVTILLQFCRLHEIGRGIYPLTDGFDKPLIVDLTSPSVRSSVTRSPHCSCCGHPGRKKNHIKVGCNYCLVEALENCMEMPAGFECECPSCDEVIFLFLCV